MLLSREGRVSPRDTFSSRSVFSNPLSNEGAHMETDRTSQSVASFGGSARSGARGEDRRSHSPSRSAVHIPRSSRMQSPTLAPINVMYIKPTSKPPSPQGYLGTVDGTERETSMGTLCATVPPIYAPGCRLTVYPTIRISNTVLSYEDSVETTTYYITIESNVSWTVCKSFREVLSFVPAIRCTTPCNAMSPEDRKVRDGVIQATLNSKLDRSLQAFILSDISETVVLRSSYLLMNNEGWKAYLFKFVGKALICYERNKVSKIFLLSCCEVSPTGMVGFSIKKSGEGVELYATCERERDAWVTDIRDYISRL